MIDNFIKDLEKKGWKKIRIAEKTGLTQQYVCNLAKGSNCSLETLVKIANAFGVSTDTVLGRSVERTITPVEELLLQTTEGNDQIARAALRSAQGEKSLLSIGGEGKTGIFKKVG